MKNKKSILLVGATAALAAVIALGSTLAYYTDTETQTNVMVSGNVDIVQHEHDRFGNDFVQGQRLDPIVISYDKKDETGYPKSDEYIDKLVSVENIGKNDVRSYLYCYS